MLVFLLRNPYRPRPACSHSPLCLYLLVVPQAVFASLRTHLDVVAFTEDVPRVRKYLTKRFAAPGGQLTPQVEDALDRESVSRVGGWAGGGWVARVCLRLVLAEYTCVTCMHKNKRVPAKQANKSRESSNLSALSQRLSRH